MQLLHDPNKSNVDNLSTVRREASRRFRNSKELKFMNLKLTVK
jgi:hypothetical protein